MICDKKDCTGCFACYNICPKKAIDMREDDNGFIYPVINDTLCVNCGLCKKVCPSINCLQYTMPQKCYVVVSRNENVLSLSTSGGIATELSKYVLGKHGVVYGAAYDGNCGVRHIRVDNIDNLVLIQGSKYVHSYITDTYRLVKNDLANDIMTLFIGTPCQIAGLKKYLEKEYENLYLVDIVCHGVPSQKYLKDEVIRTNKSTDVDRVNFRDKKYKDFTFSVKKKNVDVFSEEWYKSPYFYTFMKSIIYRENCYSCKYARNERISDLTIGDFWGLGADSRLYNKRKKGVSVVLINSAVGEKIFNSIRDNIDVEERKLSEAFEGNDQLRQPAHKNELVDKFYKLYKKNQNFYKTYKKICKKNFLKQKIKTNCIVKKLLRNRRSIKDGEK